RHWRSRGDAASWPPASLAEDRDEPGILARLAQARARFAHRLRDTPGQVALERGRAPGLVGVGVHHPAVFRWLHAALGAADAAQLPAVPAAVRALPAGAAARGVAFGAGHGGAEHGPAGVVPGGHQLLHL